MLWTVLYTQYIYVGGGVVGSYRSCRFHVLRAVNVSQGATQSKNTPPGQAPRDVEPGKLALCAHLVAVFALGVQQSRNPIYQQS